VISKISAKKWLKCVCCGEQVRTGELYFQVELNGKPVRGERYCVGCESYAVENNPEASSYRDDDEQHLRDREAYASYRAAGCTEAYWTDKDAGYI